MTIMSTIPCPRCGAQVRLHYFCKGKGFCGGCRWNVFRAEGDTRTAGKYAVLMLLVTVLPEIVLNP
jgi:hypothetical protein